MNLRKLLYLSFTLFAYISAKAQLPPVYGWARQSTRVAVNAITTDNANNLYSTGTFIGSVDFDPGTGLDTFSDKGFGDIYITKMASDGHLAWVRHFGGTSYDQGNGIVTDATGNVYVTGFFSDTVDFGATRLNCAVNNTFVLKLDSAGNIIWVKQIESIAGNYAYSLAIGDHNELILTGGFSSTTDFDPGSGIDTLDPAAGPQFILKLDTAGHLGWVKQLNISATGVVINSGIADHSGNVIVLGRLFGTADMDPGAGVYNLTETASSSTSYFLLKLDANGNFSWTKKIDSVFLATNNGGLLADAGNNYYIGGSLGSKANLDMNGGAHYITPAIADSSFILKIDSNANFLWAQQVRDVKSLALDAAGSIYTCGGTIHKFLNDGTAQWASDSSLSSFITVSPDFDIFTTGLFTGTVDFDPGPAVHTLSITGVSNEFYQKLTQPSLSVKEVTPPSVAHFTAYPNPNNGTFTIAGSEADEYFITNITGQVVGHIVNEHGIVTVKGLPEGTYLITDNNRRSVKILVRQ